MRGLAWLVMFLLILLGLAFAALALGTFAALSSGAPLWLKAIGSLEGTLGFALGGTGLAPFWRAVTLALVSSLLFALAAYYKPRA